MPMEQVPLAPVIALIAGILILIVPRLLNYIVAVYLIVVGILCLIGRRAWGAEAIVSALGG
jgi:hypothetical protein